MNQSTDEPTVDADVEESEPVVEADAENAAAEPEEPASEKHDDAAHDDVDDDEALLLQQAREAQMAHEETATGSTEEPAEPEHDEAAEPHHDDGDVNAEAVQDADEPAAAVEPQSAPLHDFKPTPIKFQPVLAPQTPAPEKTITPINHVRVCSFDGHRLMIVATANLSRRRHTCACQARARCRRYHDTTRSCC